MNFDAEIWEFPILMGASVPLIGTQLLRVERLPISVSVFYQNLCHQILCI